jgi:hypothetical protein
MRSTRLGFRCALLILVGSFSPDAMAYIGPGVGTGLIVTVLGLLASLVLAVVGIVYYPLKRFFKHWKDRRARKRGENDVDR